MRFDTPIRFAGVAVILASLVVAALVNAEEASQSSSIVLTPDEKTVCVANQDTGTVSLWAWPSVESVREIAVGSEPRTLAVSPDGSLLVVTTQRQQALAVVDLRTAKCAAKIPIGGQPVGVVLSTDGRRAFVAQYAGEYVDGQYVPGAVAVVDLAKREVTARIPVRARPFAMARSADGRSVYVTHYFRIGGKGIVTKIDTGTLTVLGEIELAEDGDVSGGRGGVFNALASIALHPQGHRALVAGMHANVRRGVPPYQVTPK